MEQIIRAAVERGASDLHIKAGDVFRARIDGKLVPLTKQRLTPDQTRAIALKLITSDEDRARLESLRDYDCSWGMPGVGRFRVNILRQRSSFMIVMRVIPFAVPTLASLGLPPLLGQLAESERGLLLVAGISGGGKTSTMAAMVHHINQTQQKHVVTVENPIEFLHRDLTCSVTQREVGVDTGTYAVGLRAALRQDPDVDRHRRAGRRRDGRHRHQGGRERAPRHHLDADARRGDHGRAHAWRCCPRMSARSAGCASRSACAASWRSSCSRGTMNGQDGRVRGAPRHARGAGGAAGHGAQRATSRPHG